MEELESNKLEHAFYMLDEIEINGGIIAQGIRFIRDRKKYVAIMLLGDFVIAFEEPPRNSPASRRMRFPLSVMAIPTESELEAAIDDSLRTR